MIWIILGLIWWSGAHWLKRLNPPLRAQMQDRMGEASKGLITAILILSIVLMWWGYKQAEVVTLWQPPDFLTHVNNLLMLLAFYVFGASAAKPAKVWLGTKIRHPQLTAVKIWALAHLLVNGDLASLVLFGGLLAWAVVSVILINRAEGPWTPPPQAPAKKEGVLIVITLVLFTVVALIHGWLGPWPFGG